MFHQSLTRCCLRKGATTNELISPIPPEVKPRFHAILIACSKYDGGEFDPLPTTIGEAKDYKKILTTFYGFDTANIVELYDKGRDEILSHLHKKVKSLTEDDNLVILFAGHGKYKKSGDEIIGYWIPLNADAEYLYVSNLDLNNVILGSKTKHILMLSDACYSGAMRSGGSEDDERAVPKSLEYEFKSRQILTSGGLTKVPGESVFIRMVIKMLELNKEKFLSAKLLYNTIFDGVRKQTDRQPELNVFGKDGNQGGQFYFIRTK